MSASMTSGASSRVEPTNYTAHGYAPKNRLEMYHEMC